MKELLGIPNLFLHLVAMVITWRVLYRAWMRL